MMMVKAKFVSRDATYELSEFYVDGFWFHFVSGIGLV